MELLQEARITISGWLNTPPLSEVRPSSFFVHYPTTRHEPHPRSALSIRDHTQSTLPFTALKRKGPRNYPHCIPAPDISLVWACVEERLSLPGSSAWSDTFCNILPQPLDLRRSVCRNPLRSSMGVSVSALTAILASECGPSGSDLVTVVGLCFAQLHLFLGPRVFHRHCEVYWILFLRLLRDSLFNELGKSAYGPMAIAALSVTVVDELVAVHTG